MHSHNARSWANNKYWNSTSAKGCMQEEMSKKSIYIYIYIPSETGWFWSNVWPQSVQREDLIALTHLLRAVWCTLRCSRCCLWTDFWKVCKQVEASNDVLTLYLFYTSYGRRILEWVCGENRPNCSLLRSPKKKTFIYSSDVPEFASAGWRVTTKSLSWNGNNDWRPCIYRFINKTSHHFTIYICIYIYKLKGKKELLIYKYI